MMYFFKYYLSANNNLFSYFASLQFLPALRYIRAIGAEDSVAPRKFFEAVLNPEDPMLFYTGKMKVDFSLFSISTVTEPLIMMMTTARASSETVMALHLYSINFAVCNSNVFHC